MTKRKHIVLIIVGLCVIAGGVWYWYTHPATQQEQTQDFSGLREEWPELSSYVDDLESANKDLGDEEIDQQSAYLNLGLAWKSLAGQTNEKEHYDQAIAVYTKGIEISERKNTLFFVNLANVLTIQERYEEAEQYLLEALSINPGYSDIYTRLLELYQYKLNKPHEEIVAFLDRGIATVLPPTHIILLKQRYLKRISDE